MARIYFAYTKNVFLEYPDYFMFAIFIAISFMLVSFHDVLMNIPKDNISNFLNFTMGALHDTHWLLQILIAGFFIRVSVSGFRLAQRKMHMSNWIPAKLRY
jgi:hypothetical protein